MFAGGRAGVPKLGPGLFLQPHRPIYSHGKYSRANSLESPRLRPPSVRLIPGLGSATNTDSAKKKVPGETIKVTKNSKGASGCLSLLQDLV